MWKTRTALAVLLTALGSLGVMQAKDKKILYTAYDREIDVLNQFTSQMTCDIQQNVVEGLIITNDKNEYIPVLAKAIPTFENGGIKKNADGTYDMTWHLQPGVKWSDGAEFTADDVLFTLDFVKHTPDVYNQSQYNHIVSAKVIDKNTITMKWDGLYTFYPGLFEAILPKHILGKLGWGEIAKSDGYNRGPQFIGTGPFMFKEWKTGEYIRLVRNPNYWRGKQYPKLDEMVFQFVPDQNARFNAMKSGRYHIGEIEATQVKGMNGANGFSVKMVPSNVFYFIGFNVASPGGRPELFGDQRVRQAFYYAINRKAIVDQLLEGTVKIANSPIPSSSPYCNTQMRAPEYNPAKAKQLLAEAGWKPGSDGILQKNGVRFSFKWLCNSARADRIAIAQVVQAQLKEVGINSTMETLEASAWTQRWRSFNYEVQIGGWFMGSDVSPTNYYCTRNGVQGSNNFTGFSNPDLDKLMLQSDKVFDFKTRKPMLDKIQQVLLDQSYNIYLYYKDAPWVVSNKLTNFRGSGTNFGNWWNTYEWDLRD